MVWKEFSTHRVDRSCSVAASRKFYNYDQSIEDSEQQDVDRNAASSDERYANLIQYVGNNVIGQDTKFTSPFGSRKVVYCDYIASGRSLKFLEEYISSEVLPHYGSTHTTATNTALQTTMFRHEARDVIRSAVRASESDRVLLTGTGATGAAVRLLHGLCLQRPPVVLAGPFLHHSALLPWREAGAKVIRIREAANGSVDLDHLERVLQQEGSAESLSSNSCGSPKSPVQVIGCFSAASNVTGVLTDTVAVTVMLHRYRALALWDYATAAPYVDIDMNPVVVGDSEGLAHKDAIFFSMHKFVGGPQTPGVLVAKRSLFLHPVPALAGGGSVFFVSRAQHRFLKEEEQREEGGTPDIVGTIRAGLVMQLKATITPECIAAINERRVRRLSEFVSSIPNLVSLGPSYSPSITTPPSSPPPRLPILSFLVRHPSTGLFLHHNFVSALLNDVYGVQARGGCACAGPYALDLLGLSEEVADLYHQALAEPSGLDRHHLRRRTEHSDSELLRPGFVRLNLPYTASDEQVEFILRSVAGVCRDGWRLLPQYSCNAETAEWRHRRQPILKGRQWLGNVSYAKGHFNLRDSSSQDRQQPAPDYSDCLARAEQLFAEASKSARQFPDTSADQLVLPDASRHLRWFMLSSEARQLMVSSGADVRSRPAQGSTAALRSGCLCASPSNGAHGSVSDDSAAKAFSDPEGGDLAHSIREGIHFDEHDKNILLDDSTECTSCNICSSCNIGTNNKINSRLNQDKCLPETRTAFSPVTYPLSRQVLEARPDYVWEQEPRLHYWPATAPGPAGGSTDSERTDIAGTRKASELPGVDRADAVSEDDKPNSISKGDVITRKGDQPSVYKVADEDKMPVNTNMADDQTRGDKISPWENFNKERAALILSNSLFKKYPELENDPNFLHSLITALEDLSVALDKSGLDGSDTVCEVPITLHQTDVSAEHNATNVLNSKTEEISHNQRIKAETITVSETHSSKEHSRSGTTTAATKHVIVENGSLELKGKSHKSINTIDEAASRSDPSKTVTCSKTETISSQNNTSNTYPILVDKSISDEGSNTPESSPAMDSSITALKACDESSAQGEPPKLKAVCSDLTCFLPRPSTGPTPPLQAKARWQAPTKNIFAPMVEAIGQFSMIRDGDRVLVCLSGGKDSLSLLHLLHQYQFYARSRGVNFALGAVTVDPESAAYDPRPLIPYLASLGVHYLYEQQGILQQALELPDLNSICSFCSRMKRGRLYAAARRHRYNVLAFGQHLDDLAESFLMSVLHNGRLRTMKAAYTTSEGDLRVVRPLVFVREKHLRHFAESRKLPVIPENCPACFEVPKERHRSKQVLAQQELLFPQVYHSLRTALLPLMAINATGLENALLGKQGVLANALHNQDQNTLLGKQGVLANALYTQDQDADL